MRNLVYSWQCPHNCTDTATCDCDNVERAIEQSRREAEERMRAEIAAAYPEHVARIARCARHFLACYDEFSATPEACQEHLDALERAVEGSPPVRYEQQY